MKFDGPSPIWHNVNLEAAERVTYRIRGSFIFQCMRHRWMLAYQYVPVLPLPPRFSVSPPAREKSENFPRLFHHSEALLSLS